VAAEQNSNKWYNSWVKLLPAPAAEVVEIYDPSTKSFVPHPESEDDPIIDLGGPFAYFLATVNVGGYTFCSRNVILISNRSLGTCLYDFSPCVSDTSHGSSL
jgi:hypothetical protein